MMNIPPRRMVVMGVSGCGKSDIGQRLATALGIAFIEGDAWHSPANIAKMAAGNPLTDDDRAAWLATLRDQVANGASLVLSCSALKRRYRDLLREGDSKLFFIELDGSRALIEQRMRVRLGHFMPTSLLDSQFGDLEPLQVDEAGLRVDISGTPAAIADTILTAISAR
jgi:gluconokinase